MRIPQKIEGYFPVCFDVKYILSHFLKRRENCFQLFGPPTISKPYGFVIRKYTIQTLYVQFVMSKLEFLRMQLTTFFTMTMGLIGL